MRHVLNSMLGAFATIALALTIGIVALGSSAGTAEAQTQEQCVNLYSNCMTTTPVPDYCAKGLTRCMSAGGTERPAPAGVAACSAPYMQCLATARTLRSCTPAFRTCVRGN